MSGKHEINIQCVWKKFQPSRHARWLKTFQPNNCRNANSNMSGRHRYRALPRVLIVSRIRVYVLHNFRRKKSISNGQPRTVAWTDYVMRVPYIEEVPYEIDQKSICSRLEGAKHERFFFYSRDSTHTLIFIEGTPSDEWASFSISLISIVPRTLPSILYLYRGNLHVFLQPLCFSKKIVFFAICCFFFYPIFCFFIFVFSFVVCKRLHCLLVL